MPPPLPLMPLPLPLMPLRPTPLLRLLTLPLTLLLRLPTLLLRLRPRPRRSNRPFKVDCCCEPDRLMTARAERNNVCPGFVFSGPGFHGGTS
jgi:hypothetical protein